MKSFGKTIFAAISRATAGIRRNTLIINLPGSEDAVRDMMEIVLPLLPRSVEILKGSPVR
jgi:molybdopterin biosynthesis enzyme MoaB